ncbi:MAG: hypothetical protein ACK5TQ_16575, partial [Acetobacteraceae bacterium]
GARGRGPRRPRRGGRWRTPAARAGLVGRLRATPKHVSPDPAGTGGAAEPKQVAPDPAVT